MVGLVCLLYIILFLLRLLAFTDELIEDEELFPDDALSNHTDLADNEPVVNETKRNFIRYCEYLKLSHSVMLQLSSD